MWPLQLTVDQNFNKFNGILIIIWKISLKQKIMLNILKSATH